MWKKSLKYLFYLLIVVMFLSGDMLYRRKELRTSAPAIVSTSPPDNGMSVFGITNPVALYGDYSLFPKDGCVGITLASCGYKCKGYALGDRRPKEDWNEYYFYDLGCSMLFAAKVSDVPENSPLTVYLASGDSVLLRASCQSEKRAIPKSVWSNKGRHTTTTRIAVYDIGPIRLQKIFTDTITSIKIEDATTVTYVDITSKQQEALLKRFLLLKDIIGDTYGYGL